MTQHRSDDHVLLGIDLGTSHLKVRAYNAGGLALAGGSARVPMIKACPGRYEQDSEVWWSLLREILGNMEKERPGLLARAEVISVCGHSHGPTPYASERGALGPCITWLDQRGGDEVAWMLSSIGEDAFIAEGNMVVDTCYTAAKLLWIKNHQPEIYRQADVFLLPKDVLVYRLTDSYSTDFTDASVTDLFSSKTYGWSGMLVERCGLSLEKLPPVNKPWDVIGEVTANASRGTGLRAGTPVIAGAADWACLYYGAGGVRPNIVVDLAGTVGGIMVTTSDDTGFPGMPSLIPGLRNSIAGSMEASSVIYEWYTDEFGPCDTEDQGRSRFSLMDAEVEQVAPGSEGLLVLPHFAGARRPQKENSKGVIFGLSLSTKRPTIARAIMEGVSYESRRAVQRIVDAGIPVEKIRAIGGGAQSSVWRQIKADVIGKPYCELNHDEIGAFGAAILGGYAIGMFSTLEDPIDRFVKTKHETHPQKEHRDLYNALFEAYCHLSDLVEASNLYDEVDDAMDSSFCVTSELAKK